MLSPELTLLDRVSRFALLVLLTICAVRFAAIPVHAGQSGLVLAATALVAALAIAAALARRSGPRRWLDVFAAVAWMPLVMVAPSFAWCAIPLFVLLHNAFSRAAALVAAAVLTITVSVSVYLLAGASDLGLMFGPLIAGLLLSFAMDALNRALDARQRLVDALMTAQDRLAHTEREAGTLAERHRLAAEIHDTVVQGAASALLLLEAAEQTWPDREASRSSVVSAQQMLRNNLAETRRLVHRLASDSLTGTLFEAIETVAADAGGRATLIGEPVPLPPETEHALLRVVQGAVANAQRHADADRIIVTLTYYEHSISVDIADDGCGFDPEAVPAPGPDGGYGLRAMRLRVEKLGGRLVVESETRRRDRDRRAPPAGGRLVIRIALVDDHPILRHGMRTLLDTQEDFEVVGDCGDPEEYRLLLTRARPDIVLMDLALDGDTDGVALTAHTRATSPSTAVLVFTTYDSDADFVRSLDAGASGYLLKDSTPAELFAAIRTARDGGSALSPAVASRLMDRIRAPQESLTPREIDVLTLLATGHTNRQGRRAALRQRDDRQDAR
ncbi:two-component system sensor protein [Leifsonia xyli subsp. cynodontis DSM 46306]|uniref:Response regulatory domain-containing protein n=1 Tax=Leifsonia xyli subsp. cynodontis DSM 46306 TaxID=1389489 RepID=U3P5U7_LEIXC|nr:two-component system sensor protein [Leifsonia xyli subsp. cynodontis DSM 46306]